MYKSTALSWTTTPHTWLHAAIKYAHEHDILIDLPFQWLKPIRQRDQSLIWGFCLRGLLYKDLLRLNRVRLFYRITCLAEVSTAKGDCIDDSRLGSHGKDAIGFCHRSCFTWPFQQRPIRTDFKYFRDVLQLTFCHDQSWRLREDLGDWTLTQEQYTSDWEWFFSPSQQLLWKVDSSGLHYAF